MEEFIIGESVSCDDFLIEEVEEVEEDPKEDPKEELNEDEEKCE